MKIGMTSVFVPNPMEAFKIYTGKLGFVGKIYMPEAYLAVVASPEDPEGTHLLLEPDDSPIAKSYKEGLYKAGIPCIVFAADDINAEVEKLKSRGVKFSKDPNRTEWGIEALFEDGCGNLIQLMQAFEPGKS